MDNLKYMVADEYNQGEHRNVGWKCNNHFMYEPISKY